MRYQGLVLDGSRTWPPSQNTKAACRGRKMNGSDFNSSMFRNRYLLYWSFWNDFFVFIFWTAQHSPSDPRCPLLWRQWRKGGRTRSAPNALNWSSVTWETGSSRRKRLPSALDWSACARSRPPSWKQSWLQPETFGSETSRRRCPASGRSSRESRSRNYKPSWSRTWSKLTNKETQSYTKLSEKRSRSGGINKRSGS